MDLYSVIQPRYLSTRYAHPVDQTITHTTHNKWYVRWYAKSKKSDSSTCCSVTSFVQKYAKCIAHNLIIREVFCYIEKKGKHKPQKTTTTIDSVRQGGIDLHHDIQWFFNGYTARSPCCVFLEWWTSFQKRNVSLCPMRTEMILRSDANLQLLGTADMLFYDTSISSTACLYIHLIDWKRTTNVHKNIKLSILQLNTYKYLLETFYGNWSFDGVIYKTIKIKQLSLVVFQEDLRGVTEYNVEIISNKSFHTILQQYVYDKSNIAQHT
jgi:hypothetical protein